MTDLNKLEDSAVAVSITADQINSKIQNVEYILPRDVCKRDNGVELFDAPLPLQTLTFCIITLENGFTVTGESACVDPLKFDADVGRRIAYENAREKIWQLEGYLLKEKLHKKNDKDAYRPNGNLTFGDALTALKQGQKVARSGWNGKDQYVVAQSQTTTTEASKIWNPHNKAHAEKLGGQIDVAPYCTLKTAQDTLAMGWIPSTGDLFANDWVIVE